MFYILNSNNTYITQLLIILQIIAYITFKKRIFFDIKTITALIIAIYAMHHASNLIIVIIRKKDFPCQFKMICNHRKKASNLIFDAIQTNNLEYIREQYDQNHMHFFDKRKNSPFYHFTPCLAACASNNVDLLHLILQNEHQRAVFKQYTFIQQVQFIVPPKTNYLQLAIICNSLQCVQYILEAMITNDTIRQSANSFNQLGQHALHFLCFIQDKTMKNLIIDNLALFNQAFTVENYNKSPLRFAIEQLDQETVKQLILTAKFNNIVRIKQYVQSQDFNNFITEITKTQKYKAPQQYQELENILQILALYIKQFSFMRTQSKYHINKSSSDSISDLESDYIKS